MIINKEPFEDIYSELFDITEKHWNECGEINGGSKFAIAYHDLVRANECGAYICYVIRKDSGEPIGYASYAVSHGVHSVCNIYAVSDAVYIAPEYRKGLARYGISLLQYAEKDLKRNHKVEIIQFSMNCSYDISRMLIKIGYSPAEIKFNKRTK